MHAPPHARFALALPAPRSSVKRGASDSRTRPTVFIVAASSSTTGFRPSSYAATHPRSLLGAQTVLTSQQLHSHSPVTRNLALHSARRSSDSPVDERHAPVSGTAVPPRPPSAQSHVTASEAELARPCRTRVSLRSRHSPALGVDQDRGLRHCRGLGLVEPSLQGFREALSDTHTTSFNTMVHMDTPCIFPAGCTRLAGYR